MSNKPKGRAPKKGDRVVVSPDGRQTLVVKETFTKRLCRELRPPQWYKPVQLFDGRAKKIVEVGDHDVILTGMLYQPGLSSRIEALIAELENAKGQCLVSDGEEMIGRDWVVQRLRAVLGEPELALCLVPPAVSDGQCAALQLMLKANLRTEVLLLSNNVHLVKLRAVSDKVAEQIMKGDTDEPAKKEPGEVVPFEEPGESPGESERQGVREEDRPKTS